MDKAAMAIMMNDGHTQLFEDPGFNYDIEPMHFPEVKRNTTQAKKRSASKTFHAFFAPSSLSFFLSFFFLAPFPHQRLPLALTDSFFFFFFFFKRNATLRFLCNGGVRAGSKLLRVWPTASNPLRVTTLLQFLCQTHSSWLRRARACQERQVREVTTPRRG